MDKCQFPKISILLPVYNNKDDILRSIDSVVKQTLADWELIIIDDHSTDGTRDQIIQYLNPRNSQQSNQISQIILICNDRNYGTYISLNKGLQKACGQYICRIDSDDQWDPDLLKKQSLILDNDHDNQYVATQSLVKKNDGTFSFGEITVMYRRSIIQEIGYYDSVRYGADTEFLLRIRTVYGQHKIYRLHEPLYYYRFRQNSLTSSTITGLLSATSGRRQYLKAAKDWHQKAISKQCCLHTTDATHTKVHLYLPFPLIHRPFEVDPKMLPNGPQ